MHVRGGQVHVRGHGAHGMARWRPSFLRMTSASATVCATVLCCGPRLPSIHVSGFGLASRDDVGGWRVHGVAAHGLKESCCYGVGSALTALGSTPEKSIAVLGSASQNAALRPKNAPADKWLPIFSRGAVMNSIWIQVRWHRAIACSSSLFHALTPQCAPTAPLCPSCSPQFAHSWAHLFACRSLRRRLQSCMARMKMPSLSACATCSPRRDIFEAR